MPNKSLRVYQGIRSMSGSFFNPYQRQAEAVRNRRFQVAPELSDALNGQPAAGQEVAPEPTNVMEILVKAEAVRQMQLLPPKTLKFIKLTQVKAYALNVLPPLYVTSEKGWHRYWQKGNTELKEQITQAVRQGIAAVQRDPLREISALPHEKEPIADATLNQIKRLLGNESLTWYNVVPAMKRALRHAQQSGTSDREQVIRR